MIKARITHVNLKITRAILLLEENDTARIAEAIEVLLEASELTASMLADLEQRKL